MYFIFHVDYDLLLYQSTISDLGILVWITLLYSHRLCNTESEIREASEMISVGA
jgi:hypothetical protein